MLVVSHEHADLGHWIAFWAFVVVVVLVAERVHYRREKRRRALWREEQER